MRRLRRAYERHCEPVGDGEASVDPNLPYKGIRSAEKILAPGEDWRLLGTDADPIVVEVAAQEGRRV